MTPLYIAKLCHETNRAYCQSIGDDSQLPWDEAPEWQRQSSLAGVTDILMGLITTPEQAHESWLANKAAQGWAYGPVKDALATPPTHPCMVPYEQLPAAQQFKDALIFYVVNICTHITDEVPHAPVDSTD